VNGCAFALFDTSIGRCAILWRGGLIVGAALPEASDEAARRQLSRRFLEAVEDTPSAEAAAAITAVVRLLEGEKQDLSDITVDLTTLPEFERRVLEETRRIPTGETRTYGELAAKIGAAGVARAVGRALGRNPAPIIIPCHRVLAAGGGSGGFSAPGGVTTKMRMLQIERARRSSAPELFDELPLAMKPALPAAPPPSGPPSRAR
jgi:methylated-DNA-[protein]-cysteine S-methyltransferase